MTDVVTPLAERLRPSSLHDICGHDHLVQEGGLLYKMVKERHFTSMILWGPPGCGKTTMARVLMDSSGYHVHSLSAVSSGVSDLRAIVKESARRKESEERSIVFIDEVHRFNRAQQDFLLGPVEDGTILLIGATTENPSFEVNAALLSRCQLICLEPLGRQALAKILHKAEMALGVSLPLKDKERDALLTMCDGDARILLNDIDILSHHMSSKRATIRSEPSHWTWEDVKGILHKRIPLHDKDKDMHYALASALHKSLRASDTDAALYWLARAIVAGESPDFIARRLTRFANEDIGLADPHAVGIALSAWDAWRRLGAPEGELALAQAVIYLGTSAKSNAAYKAWHMAYKRAQETPHYRPPKAFLPAPTHVMKQLGYGKDYRYDHDEEDGFSGQSGFPHDMARESFYHPVSRGFEREIQKRLTWWHKRRMQKMKDEQP
ncbi:MAG: replication-associated recombination protein A [Alphaproteobacteria bacterium GM7ARS4]|nr:replication-associated recombination protein A [Alphaproteobacteria bacterium GM7ARS4]